MLEDFYYIKRTEAKPACEGAVKRDEAWISVTAWLAVILFYKCCGNLPVMFEAGSYNL
jgi:hypothetical protein